MDGDRLSPEDETAVRDVLKYHHKSEEKTGPGIDYIKVTKQSKFSTFIPRVNQCQFLRTGCRCK